MQDIYGEKIFTAYQREANQFKSILLLNDGKGKFKKVDLPNMLQTMPILDSDVYDFNDDGFEDILVVGNIYNTEVETPRLDNMYALVLISNQKDNYSIVNPNKTGLYLKGNAKSVKLIKHTDLIFLISPFNINLMAVRLNDFIAFINLSNIPVIRAIVPPDTPGITLAAPIPIPFITIAIDSFKFVCILKFEVFNYFVKIFIVF